MDNYKILIPVDASICSQSALRFAVSLARAQEMARMTLLFVDSGVVPLYDEQLGVLEPNRLMSMMKLRVAQRAVDADVPIEERVEYGEPAEKIVEVAIEIGANLIVMGTHGRTGLDRVLMGSVAQSVLRGAPCPVLLVKDGT
jgi:nucleotide-binding universal stress UspA family protein